ncbi:MAG: cytosine deaminase [Pseudomonadota bacterium]
MDFRTLPNGPLTLANLTAPGCLVGSTAEAARIDLGIADGRLTEPGIGETIDMAGAMVFPTFVDMHTHLDKGHIWGRAPNPDGTFMGALSSVGEDRAARWSADDVRRRIDFTLRSAYVHGTGAIRTHIDSIPPQQDISWPVFREIRTEWAGRIDLQAVCLVGIDRVGDTPEFTKIADIVAQSQGVLGAVTYPDPELEDKLRLFFRMAEARGLDADFHVDETLESSVATLRVIAKIVLETGFQAPVTVGHCCSLSTQPEAEALKTLDLVAQAGINVVSLPLCNLYLQDRHAARTPRYRGVTLVHEMKTRGINVSFASDNTRDPFYAFGDLDMLEVMREATRIAHLDHSDADWVNAFLTNPAKASGFQLPYLAPGAPADLVICKARNFNELMSRPQSDRIVLRGGEQIDRTLPDYSELDDLMEPA